MTAISSGVQQPRGDHARQVIELAAVDFDQMLADHPIVLIDFWAPWCGPCRAFSPVYEGVARKFSNVLFAKVNVDKQSDLAERCQIRSIPTLLLFRAKKLVHTRIGALTAEGLESVIKSALTG